MKRIYLARHGQDEDNARGILNGQRNMPLSPLGLEQADILATKVQELGLGITKIYSSPLERAFRTADTVAGKLGLPEPEKVDMLIERDFGIMTGQLVADIEKMCAPNIVKADPIIYFLDAEGAETFAMTRERAESFLSWLEKNCEEENILIVCHGDIAKMIYTVFYGLEWMDVLTKFHIGNSDVLLLEQGSSEGERHIHKVEQFNH